MKKYKVGILGATGTVGQKFISLLENHPWFEIAVLAASSASAGMAYKEAVQNRWIISKSIPEKIKSIVVLNVIKDKKKIAQAVDFVFCAVNMKKEEINKLEEEYAKMECPVISNNSAHRLTPDVPMIIPEINAEHMKIIEAQRKRLGTKKGFIAVKSNCSIQCFVPALSALLDLKLKNILVCTYQAISGAGKTFETWPEMVDNLIPFISGEEEKSEIEPLKVWGKLQNNEIVSCQSINITARCFRVPVSEGHTAAVFASFKKTDSCEEIIKKWNNYKGHKKSLGLPSSPKKFIHYFENENRPQIKLDRDLENGMGIAVGRLKLCAKPPYDIQFVCMTHNTIRGAAGGAILMAEMLCRENYI